MKRKSVLSILLVASMVFSPLSGIGSVEAQATEIINAQMEIFVDVNGDDSNAGTADEPFATIERAQEEVRKNNTDMTGDIVVNIGAGDYYLEDTIVFDETDSGTNGYEVIYRSEDGNGAANLIGGELITGWIPTTEEDVNYDLDPSLVGKVYKVQLDPEQYEFNTLYVNDERAVMARTRNRDNNPNFPMAKGEYMRSAGGDNNNLNMYYNSGDIDEKSIAGMVNAQKRGEEEIAQLFVWDGGDWDWFTNTIPIASINTGSREIKFPVPPAEYPEKYRTKYNIGSGARYFLQGNLAFMDVEGEYHYNKSTGVLYYYPKAEDGAMEDQTVIVPTMQKVLYFKGADKADLADVPDPDKQVHNITIDGLAVKDTEFADYFTYSWNWGDTSAGIGYYPAAAEGSTNPSYCESVDRDEFRVGSITLTGTHDITITNTRVKNTGLYGIIFAGDNQYNTVKDSVIESTGYGGLIFEGGYPAIGKYNNHNTVENVLIHEVGELVGHAVGLTVMSSGQNEFTNMEIYDTPKRAILVIGGFRRNRNGADSNYDEIKDMYTVGNHFDYIHVHDAQQDAGEDSAVFLSWLLAGKDVKALHGSNDPNNLTTNLDGIDTSIDRYNYFNQMLITDVGADPSVIEKCTAGGLDTAMGATGSQFTNIKAANTQAHLLAIRDQSQGDGYGDMYNYENCTNNLYSDDCLKTFDDSAMEYDKIGLTDSFPGEYRTAKRTYREAPDDLYFYDDFEASGELDTKKWMVEKGELEMHIGYGFMSENPTIGRRSLPINADLNRSGIVVSRTFENDLNKIVEVQYMDRRKDYANNDRNDAVATEILPNSFLRVDDGKNALGLGAVGSVSKDYYQIKKGDELIQTDVKRCFGWHTFKFDYSSGADVKLYIDDQLVATYTEADGVSTSFNYIGMGDWEGKGGKAFFDQLYVYGGQEAPPVEDLPDVYTIPGTVEAENYLHMAGVETEDCTDEEGGSNLTAIDAEDWMQYYVKVNKSGSYTMNLRINVPEEQTADFDVLVDGETVKTIQAASTDSQWATVTEKISLTDGLHKIKFVAKTGNWKLNRVTYDFAGQEVPCKIEAENYTDQSGTQTEDVSDIGGGQGVGYIDSGDWLEYKAIVNEPGTYTVKYRVAVNNADGKVEFFANGESLAVTTLPGTGGWQNWSDVKDTVEFKEAGIYTIRLNVVTGGWNINYFEITEKEETPDLPTPPENRPAIFLEENFEGETVTEFAAQKGNAIVEVIQDPEDETNRIMHVTSKDDFVYYADGMEWSDYTFECKIKIANWGIGGAYDWDNMAPVWNAGSTDSKGNFNRYSLKYRRASQDFALYRRAGNDTDMITAAAPENYEGTWHDYKITTKAGLITAFIDGEQIFEYSDSANPNGTIGFDGISVEYYVDDIKVGIEKTPNPSVDVEEGTYTGSVTLHLSAESEDHNIFYTLDGSDPTDAEHGKYYTPGEDIVIDETSTLKFVAVKDGAAYSDIIEKQYVIEKNPGLPFEEDFEGETFAEFTVNKGNAQIEVIQDPKDESNHILHVTSPDDMIYYADGMEWSNYTFECKIKIDNWEAASEQQPWDNMAPAWYVGSPDDRGNYRRYSLKYIRADQKFSLYRRTEGDKDMVYADAPADYEGTWHTYKITTVDGLITAFVDGVKIFEYSDSSNTAGTIGFDGIDVEYYVDDICVYEPTLEEPEQPADKSVLKAAVESAEELYEEDYTEESFAPFKEALVKAQEVLKNENATQEDVDAALEALTEAQGNLVEKEPIQPDPVDKSALEAAIARVASLNEKDYTAESWSVLADAKAEAERVFADEDATQEDVDAAVKALTEAENNLEEKPEEPEKPVNPPVINKIIEKVKTFYKKLIDAWKDWFGWK